MATTPPPAPSRFIRTPPTPKHGPTIDNFEPYPPRKSTRNKPARHSTPPPALHLTDTHSLSRTPQTSKRSTSSHLTLDTFSPPPTVRSSPKKKVGKASTAGGSRRRVSGRLNDDNTAFAAAALGISPTGSDSIPTIYADDMDSSIVAAAGTLPTPAKTPRKRPVQADGLKSVARTLFPVRAETVEEVMPSPQKKRAKKYKGFSLDSFMGEGEDDNEGIAIYTDSKDRVPEMDASEDNPFHDKVEMPATPAKGSESQVRRASKRRRVSNRNQDVKDEFDKNEGMVYVFRGKKMYRKFDADADEDEDEDDDNPRASPSPLNIPGVTPLDLETSLSDLPATALRPLTRSSVKPRLLFPTAAQAAARSKASHHDHHQQSTYQGHTDEEAITDIDDAALHPLPSSDSEDHHETPQTPDVEDLTPFSPPSTTKTRKKAAGAAAQVGKEKVAAKAKDKGAKRTSPFAAWQRTKASNGDEGGNGAEGKESVSANAGGKKRSGEALTATSKRTRSGEYHN